MAHPASPPRPDGGFHTPPPELDAWRDPDRIYQERSATHRRRVDELERRSLLLSRARMLVFAAGTAELVFLLARHASGVWLLPAVALFLGLALFHRAVDAQLERARRGLAHVETARKRRAGASVPQPSGARWLEADHPYAEHLDLFGPDSLYQRMCTARTMAGQETLARWLLEAAPVEELRRRQEAVEELRGACDLREEVDLLGERVATGIDPELLHQWAASRVEVPPAHLRWGMGLLSLATVAALFAWLGWGMSALPFLALIGISWWIEQRLLRSQEGMLTAIDAISGQLGTLGRVLEYIEELRYESPLLVRLRDELGSDAERARPSRRIQGLRRRLEWLDSARNFFFAPVAVLLAWKLQMAWALQAWMATSQDRLDRWLEAVGSFEALLALSAWAFEHPEDVWPVFEDEPGLRAEAMGHPLLSPKVCVRNDVRLDRQRQVELVSGSNMSGKSTFLRTVGLNVVLAQAGTPVRAHSLRLSPLAVGASLRIVDSLPQGISHFYAEVRRLRRLSELLEGDRPVLLLLDEIFHGTNSHDRRVGAEAVLRRFVREGAFVLVTTHDLALTELVEVWGGKARNVHFEDQVVDGRMVFDYVLREGVAPGGNALAILQAEGLIEAADLETGAVGTPGKSGDSGPQARPSGGPGSLP